MSKPGRDLGHEALVSCNASYRHKIKGVTRNKSGRLPQNSRDPRPVRTAKLCKELRYGTLGERRADLASDCFAEVTDLARNGGEDVVHADDAREVAVLIDDG